MIYICQKKMRVIFNTLEPDKIFLISGIAVGFVAVTYIFGGPNFDGKNKRVSGRPQGLVNIGNTCFANSLVQALASCEPFCLFLLRRNEDNISISEHHHSVTKSLHLVIASVNDKCTEGPNSLTELLEGLNRGDWFTLSGQQDCHELFNAIMSVLEVEMEQVSCKQTTWTSLSNERDLNIVTRGMLRLAQSSISVDESWHTSRQENGKPNGSFGSGTTPSDHSRASDIPFLGLLSTQLTCLRCGLKSAVQFEKFHALSLLFPSSSQGTTLLKLLSQYFTEETLGDIECECSPKYQNSKVKKKKQMWISRFPKCLCIHMQRSTWSTGHMWKRMDVVTIADILSLDKFSYGFYNGLVPSSHTARLQQIYQLQSVIVHTGLAYTGHFITYRRFPVTTNRWWRISDESVTRSTLEEALKSEGYILFYSKVKI